MMKIIILLTLITSLCSGQFRSPEITEHPADLLVSRNAPATLNCHAEGRPKPGISWYKNGKLFKSKDESGRHMLLDNGDLFFLQVLQTKKEDDSGIYWCQASNSVGTVKSKNATLEIAVLREDFQLSPDDTHAAEGEAVLLRCIPPRGHPDPVVLWTKNGDEVDPATEHRYKVVEEGSLNIQDVRITDSGMFSCTARNVYATRTSEAAFLKILVPPHLVASSEDIIASAGSTVELVCRVGGDPPPEIFWEKALSGDLPVDRMSLEENAQVLRIRHTAATDQGIYTCRSENPAGVITKNISVIIQTRPIIDLVPDDTSVSRNDVATFQCEVSGNPIPAVYWYHENKGVIIEKSQSWEGGRISVDSHNTLTIRKTRKEDRGFYLCAAVGIVGSAIARVHLEIQDVLDMPPPIIALGAPNQTLPLGTEAEIPCDAIGHPEPRIYWYYSGKRVQESMRTTINPFGTLKITKLKFDDTGVYTCKAISESGTTIWTASLIVAKPTNPNVAFFKMHNEGALPEPPGHLIVESMNTTSVKLGWRRGRSGSSPVLGYTIQQWSPNSKGPWSTSTAYPETVSTMPVSYRVTSLKPSTKYAFLVRASNSHGLSRPSAMTHMVKTLNSNEEGKIPFEEIRTRLDESAIRLSTVQPVSSSSLKVSWNLRIDADYINGIHLRYRSLGTNKTLPGALNMETVHFGKIKKVIVNSYLIRGLESGTIYEVFAAPFYRNLEGKPSAAIHVTTLDAIPVDAPLGLHHSLLNKTSAIITWDPIQTQERHPQITGYNILIIVDAIQKSIHTNATIDASWVLISNFTPGESYQVFVRGLTESGSGPTSAALSFTIPNHSGTDGSFSSSDLFPNSNINSDNYLTILISLAAIAIFLSLLGTIVFIYKKRSEEKFQTYLEKEVNSSWAEYPKFWNDTSKGPSARVMQYSDIIGSENHFYREIPTEPLDGRLRDTKTFEFYDDPSLEGNYEDPDGLRLVSFAKQSNKRGASPSPYATSTIVSSARLKSFSTINRNLPPNIQLDDMKKPPLPKEVTYDSSYAFNFDSTNFKDPRSILQLDRKSDYEIRTNHDTLSSFYIKQDVPSMGPVTSQISTFVGTKRSDGTQSKSSTYGNDGSFEYDTFSTSSSSSHPPSLVTEPGCIIIEADRPTKELICREAESGSKYQTSFDNNIRLDNQQQEIDEKCLRSEAKRIKAEVNRFGARNSLLLSMTSPLI